MFRPRCSRAPLKIPSVQRLAVGIFPSLHRPCCSLPPLNCSCFIKSSITTTTSPLLSHRSSNMLDPKSLMKDMESELFNYTTGRFM